MRRMIFALLVVFGILATPTSAPQDRSATGPACQFALGFAALHALDPTDIGDCLDNEEYNPVNGDALQHTTNGLLVWRKADNFTAFTNGSTTWINGPNGLAERPNTQRFPWEANPDGLPLTGASDAASSASVGPTIGRYGVFEQTISYPSAALANPWEDATVTATFTAPSNRTITVKGFYYDVNTYKVRFMPQDFGVYSYTIAVQGPTPLAPLTGSFTVTPSSRKGIPHPLATDPRRLVFDDGSLDNAIGFNDCWPHSTNPTGSIGEGQQVDADTYFSTYGDAGFNLLRWNPGNCSMNIYQTISTSGNRYLVDEGKDGDALLQDATQHGFQVMFTFFFQPVLPEAAGHADQQAAVERYLSYAMARYGAYTDIWELGNENDANSLPDAWVAFAAQYVHANDPYHRIVTNSFPRPSDGQYLDARSPHWYATEDALNADLAMKQQIDALAGTNEPIIFGEQGNGTCNWDPTSALRMSIRSWTAFFDPAMLVFWNTSTAKNYCASAANIYLGEQERQYVRALQNFTAGVDPDVATTPVAPTNPDVRGYGLQSSRVFLAYFQHFRDHVTPVTTDVTVTIPANGTAAWTDPQTGTVVGTTSVPSGTATLTSPSFAIDMALRITVTGST
jgi:hypothetical protein